MNKVELMGRLTKDVEVLTYNAGNEKKKMVKFSIAVQRKRDKEKVDFFDCIAYGSTAKALNDFVKKGERIIVEGTMQTDIYTNKEGKNVKTYTVLVNDFYFTEYKKTDKKEEF